MSARRTRTTKVEVPVPQRSEAPSTTPPTIQQSTSPFLPTTLEATLLALYPATLLIGSLYSSLHASTRNATYSVVSQAYEVDQAPSYFAKKSNVFNVYFVKVGWLWITVAFVLFLLTHPPLGPPLRPTVTRRRAQAAIRYSAMTTAWIFVTQWFFGAPIIDRSFRWTGGQCATVQSGLPVDEVKKDEMSDVREVLTHAACKAIGGQWRGGHDISGHVFLLILGSAMLWLELLPAVRKGSGASQKSIGAGSLGLGGQFSVAIALLSWWMLFMTAAFFHTWFEKLTGLLVAFAAIYVVYFLPRAAPALRSVIGVPGE